MSAPSGPLLAAWKQQERANEKVRRARQMMPFLRKLVHASEMLEVTFDREEVVLDLESMRDCIMAEVKDDPELDEDQRVMIANLVSGLSKNWSRILEFVYTDKYERMIALGGVSVAFLDILYHRWKVAFPYVPEELRGSVIARALGVEPTPDRP